jgi:hypothetical protein
MRDDNVQSVEFEGEALDIPSARLPTSEPIQQKARLAAFRDPVRTCVCFNRAGRRGRASAADIGLRIA